MSTGQYDALYDRGIAVGSADIKNDTVLFRYRDETFEFPTAQIYLLRFLDHGWNGYFYTAPVDKLREMELEAASNAIKVA